MGYKKEIIMGFSLKCFLEELEDMLESGYSYQEIIEYVREQRQYAEKCNEI